MKFNNSYNNISNNYRLYKLVFAKVSLNNEIKPLPIHCPVASSKLIC